MGLGAALVTFAPSTIIRSGDVNANLAALNNATAPTFTTLTVTGLVTAGGYSFLSPTGVRITVGPTAPVGPSKWDVWVQTPFS